MDALTSPIQHFRRTSRGFSITELLVVIAIIVLLAGLLVVAMGRVRESSLRTATLSTMQNFGRACDAFQMDHGFYPGVIPEQVLAAAEGNNEINFKTGAETGSRTFTSTENALLHLMGGYRVCPPGTPGCSQGVSGQTPIGDDYSDFQIGPSGYEIAFGKAPNQWLLKVNPNRIGEGPYINGKPYAPYYSPGTNEVRVVRGQVRGGGLPDLVDAWGMPILYTRRIRNSGPLVGPADATGADRPQFVIEGLIGYINSPDLGERGRNQTLGTTGSILYETTANLGRVHERFAQIIRHPALGSWNVGPLHADNRGRVAPRGEYVLISAGPDGIYFARNDGPGSAGSPISTNANNDIVPPGDNNNANAVSAFDDIVIFGGG